jgi:hypothetical protein
MSGIEKKSCLQLNVIYIKICSKRAKDVIVLFCEVGYWWLQIVFQLKKI